MIVFGISNKKIKKYHDNMLVCEFCDKPGLDFSVYRQCVHIFWIPVMPVSSKNIKCTCSNCGAECGGGGKSAEYLARARMPVYMFTLLLLLIAFIVFAVVKNIDNSKNNIKYINEPQAGDIYLIKDKNIAGVKYYFFKVKETGEESVIVYHGASEYNKFVSKMSDEDYFVTNDEIEIFNDDLKKYLNDGIIYYVKRGYGSSGNFLNEGEMR